MTDSTENTAPEQITATDIAQIIVELQKYRDRLVNDTLEAVQKAKLPKSKAMAEMEPELAKIDAMMVDLQARQAALVEIN
jgi:Fe-S-cluster formation regulator IscX/YfhJ